MLSGLLDSILFQLIEFHYLFIILKYLHPLLLQRLLLQRLLLQRLLSESEPCLVLAIKDLIILS